MLHVWNIYLLLPQKWPGFNGSIFQHLLGAHLGSHEAPPSGPTLTFYQGGRRSLRFWTIVQCCKDGDRGPKRWREQRHRVFHLKITRHFWNPRWVWYMYDVHIKIHTHIHMFYVLSASLTFHQHLQAIIHKIIFYNPLRLMKHCWTDLETCAVRA